MKKRILALLLAVCVACSMLILPASASGSNTAVQTAVTLGGLTSDQTANLAAPLTRGALTKLMVAFSAYRESAKTQGYGRQLPPGQCCHAGRSLHRGPQAAGL